MKNTITLFSLIFALSFAQGQIIFQETLSPRIANYEMDVVLDVEKKQVSGTEILTWRNTSGIWIAELPFHLYMNAFKNNRSTFVKEIGCKAEKLEEEKAWGWIDIHAIRIVGGPDLTDSMTFIHPDDDNEEDQTVMQVSLPTPLRPDREIQLEIEFTTQLPIVYRRNGYYKDFFFISQWFPKIGVHIDGEWNCHQFHANTEFFADFGVYEVNITLPEKYVVGATGSLQNTRISGDEKILTYRAEDVHDFAWTAWPEYLMEKEKYLGVEITVLYEKDHQCAVQKTMDAMKYSLDFMTEWVGEYPYPGVTVVHPPTHCMNVAGMEYPTLFTGGALWGIPKEIRLTELVVIHEFTHNYWQGMVANNEFEEAWLDEGINTYTEKKIIDRYYGRNNGMIDLPGFKMGELAYHRSVYIQLSRWDRILRPAWTYIGGGYGTNSYSKPALMLTTLENLVGEETMNRIMRTYFQRWKFKHPKSQDFIDVVHEITGQDFNDFFDQLLKNSLELDYRVASVKSRKVRDRKGVFEIDGEKKTLPEKDKKVKKDKKDEEDEKDETLYHTIVKIHRKGEVTLPVDIMLVFEEGDTIRTNWDGQEKWIKFEYTRPEKLKYAAVDPDHKLVLDTRFYNNSRSMERIDKPIFYLKTRFLYTFETLFHIIDFLG
jgi:hypothetical protein